MSCKGFKYQPKDALQEKYVQLLKNDQMSIVINTGPAGSGKTLFAVQEGISQLKTKKKEKMIITRPLVHVSNEQLGYLPGDVQDKMFPYIIPIYDYCKDMLDTKEIKHYITNQQFEIAPLAYMRGRTFKNSFVILDEAQNTTPEQMKMFLTRIGEGSKMVINGDVQQSDIKGTNGLFDLLSKIDTKYTEKNVLFQRGIGIIQFTNEHIYRHSTLQWIVKLYES